jgi:hypothetical protein
MGVKQAAHGRSYYDIVIHKKNALLRHGNSARRPQFIRGYDAAKG